MSTQFRSRIKSVVDYGTDLKNVGTCCFSNRDSQTLTFYECFSQNGTFYVGENVQCPDQGEIGQCYACAYLTGIQKQQVIDTNGSILGSNTSWGVRDVTRCECTRIGGQFGSTSDPNYPNRDIRIPKACCYFDYNANGFPVGITCENVCSEKECSLKGVTYASYGACCDRTKNTCTYGPASDCDTSGEFPEFQFYPNTPCYANICSTTPSDLSVHTPLYTADKLCSEVNCNASSMQFDQYALMALGTDGPVSFEIGPCYELISTETGFTYTCDLKVLHDCPGYWVSPSLSEEILLCDNPYKPQVPIKNNITFVDPEIMTESEFDSLGIQIGDEYKGGYYIGKYLVDGAVFGSLNFTQPEQRYYEDNSPRGQHKKWAIIVDFKDLVFSMMDRGELDYSAPLTSNTDGFYNCYGDLNNFSGFGTKTTQTIKNTFRNGFADFYVPSINELYFMALILNQNPNLVDILDINQNLTSSSIFFENISSQNTKTYNFNGTVFTYGQNLNTKAQNFGYTVLIPGFDKSPVRMIRRIILT